MRRWAGSRGQRSPPSPWRRRRALPSRRRSAAARSSSGRSPGAALSQRPFATCMRRWRPRFCDPQKVLQPAFRRRSRLHAAGRASSRASTFTKKPPFTLTYHIRPRGALERRRAGHGAATSSSRTGRSAEQLAARVEDVHASVRSVRAVDAKTVRVVLRSPLAGWREPLRRRPAAACARGRGPRRQIWTRRDRQSEDGQADRERPVPRRALGARAASSRFVRNPRYWGPHRPTSTGSSFASASVRAAAADPVEWSPAAASSTSP